MLWTHLCPWTSCCACLSFCAFLTDTLHRKLDWDTKGVRALLNDLIKIHKSAPKFDDHHYLDKFSRQSVDLPDFQCTVMFPRCRQPGYRPEAAQTGLEPRGFEELKTVLPMVEQSQAPSSDDLPVQNMRLVDGWRAFLCCFQCPVADFLFHQKLSALRLRQALIPLGSQMKMR